MWLYTGIDPGDLGTDRHGDGERAETGRLTVDLVAVIEDRHFSGMHRGARDLGNVVDRLG